MTNVDDRRADGPRSGGGLRFPFPGGAGGRGGSGGLPIGKGGGILGLVIALAVVFVLAPAGRGRGGAALQCRRFGPSGFGAAGIRAGWTG